jgi:hypothetical protein
MVYRQLIGVRFGIDRRGCICVATNTTCLLLKVDQLLQDARSNQRVRLISSTEQCQSSSISDSMLVMQCVIVPGYARD